MIRTLAVLSFVAAILPAVAAENDFLSSLEGNWQGSGFVRLRPEGELINVSCSLNNEANGASISMGGVCRAKAVFSRHIGVDLQASGARYLGSYVGSRRGPARLSGARSGNLLTLQVRWPDNGSGPRTASMQVETAGAGHMRLVTTEKHPDNGQPVVTAQIAFSRR
ncbi:MAG: hypothetical protein ABS35_18390 [Kaistia sp. SCN 65-12]|nr:MAG: hypothetical protein ABS35_18390 [Kaistia sp. SCN 65-12]